ncbi:MAG: tRNA lysidine(34) synthetase TilS [Myxococcales bacterium]|nr:tRNA lysidine(34) synthetase TilS [Myxococcales bacterium]MDH3484927.1 tRNA lysidine(34) synthetase TilS [Myxococcales bacterium]
MLTSTVRRTLRERALVEAGDHVLVACSGGPDSTALLHVLHRLRADSGVTLCAASIDHALRAESGSEVAQVGNFAGALGIPFRSARIQVAKEEASIQARARELRYQALHDIAREMKATRIAVGHTQDDQAETVLSRMLRGAGLRGLSGIEARRADGVIRPLFDCRRADVLAYAEERSLPFIEDPSNHQRAYERVRIRHEVMPTLFEEDARVVEHLCAIADEAAELNAALDAEVPELPASGDRSFVADRVARLAPPLRVRWLRLWLARETGLTPTRSHLTEVGRLLTAPGEVLLGSGWSIRRDGDGLLLEYREHRRTRSTPL